MQELENKLKKPTLDLTGGESVYCINQAQMKLARKLLDKDSSEHERLRELFSSVTGDLTRNEQAALSFLIIDHLNSSPLG